MAHDLHSVRTERRLEHGLGRILELASETVGFRGEDVRRLEEIRATARELLADETTKAGREVTP